MAEEPMISQEAQGSYIAQATGGGTATIHVHASPPSLSDQNRARFLVRLRTRYRDLLAQSLQGVVRMTLELAGHPDAVAPPVRLLYQSDQQPTCPLPVGTSLLKVYEDAGHELLLLGEPGAGKSTLLLELAFDLVGQAEQDHSLLLPVIVPLSSWATKRQPLELWLAEQVALLYDLPRRLSERWVQEERLLPLLDGLDEMEEEARATCITAINAYHREHLHPLVVAGRKAEYEAAATNARLVLHRAVVVQSLTIEQVDAYLEQSGERVAALRTALRENPVLQEVATTPLMLSILLLTYQGKAVNGLPSIGSLPEQQRQVFARYVERMVERKGKLACSSPQDLVCWLRWLGQQMREHDQTIFYLEHLQPNYLTSMQQRSYAWWAVRLPALLVGILASLTVALFFNSTELFRYAALGGLLGWLFSKSASSRGMPPDLPAGHHRQGRLHRFGRCIPPGIVIGLIAGLSFVWDQGYGEFPYDDWLRDGFIFGVVIGISSLVLSVLLPSHPSEPAAASTRRPFLIHLIQTIHAQRALLVISILGAGYVLDYGLSYGLSAGLNSGLSDGLGYGLRDGLSDGLGFGLISVLVSLILEAQAEGIALTERLHWTWRSLMRSLLAPKHVREALLVGSLIGLSIGLRVGLNGVLKVGLGNVLSGGLGNVLSDGLSQGLGFGLSSGLLYWILLGLFQGIESSRIEDRARHLPNQGVRRSLYNSMLLALMSSGMIGVIGVLSGPLSIGLSIGLGTWLSYVLSGPLSIGLSSGPSYGLSDGLRAALSDGLSYVLNNALSDGLGYALSNGWLVAVCGGLLVCASRGGLAALRHYVIRLLLARSHAFPWHAPQFLEEATARILLRRVGGGYSFPHRLLLDYFADLPQQTP